MRVYRSGIISKGEGFLYTARKAEVISIEKLKDKPVFEGVLSDRKVIPFLKRFNLNKKKQNKI